VEYPYQVVTFFNHIPEVGDFVYEGAKGWFPQLAIKRRFGLSDVTEAEMLDRVRQIAGRTEPFLVTFKKTLKPEPMPVEVIEVEQSSELSGLHQELFNTLRPSKFAGREGENFYPHMTISWGGERVVDVRDFEDTRQTVRELWVLKDDGEDSRAMWRFELG